MISSSSHLSLNCTITALAAVIDTDALGIFTMSSTFGGKYSIEKELAIGGCGQC